MDIAIIGAGFAGMTFASLCKSKHNITVYEKARGVGGRMTHRRHAQFDFDHGAQYFTVRDPRFRQFLQDNFNKELQSWYARFASFENGVKTRMSNWQEKHYVGVPAMNSLCKKLSAGLDVLTNTKITQLIKKNDKWLVYADEDKILGSYDLVISTAPPEQTVALIPEICSFITKVAEIKMQSCYTLMLGFASNPLPDFDVAHILDDDLSWVSVNSSKPGRDTLPSVVVNSTNSWADANILTELDIVKNYMLKAADKLLMFSEKPVYHDIHRWRYANIGSQHGPKSFYDPELNIGACGDWCIKGRVEAAFLSALSLYESISEI